jgi:hypothetical protein
MFRRAHQAFSRRSYTRVFYAHITWFSDPIGESVALAFFQSFCGFVVPGTGECNCDGEQARNQRPVIGSFFGLQFFSRDARSRADTE